MHAISFVGLMPFFAVGLLSVSASASSLNRVVLSVDVGTESTRAALFDRDGKKLGSAAAPHTTTHPQAGWAEQHADDCACVRSL